MGGVALVVLLAVFVCVNWDEIPFFLEFESLGSNAQGYPEYRQRETDIVFVRLPGGTFNMGSPPEEQGRYANEGPVHAVTLSPFFIAKYELSQAEWKRVMGKNPSYFKGENLPVETVSWDDCQQFCERTGLSLPTEAQWEYACRAGTEGPYAGTGNLVDMGWYLDNSGRMTHPVGEKSPNEFGLYDMHGNVREWCEDVIDREFYKKPEASRKNPFCTSGSEDRVFRGGSWGFGARGCRSAYRSRILPSVHYDNVGFRPSRPSGP